MISIVGLDKREVFKALYDRAEPFGMGFLHYREDPLTEAEVDQIMRQPYFDYVYGRCMKIRFREDDTFEEYAFDQTYGPGSAQNIIDKLRKS